MSQADESHIPNPAFAASERRRKLEAISGPWWVEVVASINRTAKPKIVHTPVNRDQTAFQGWGNR